MNRSTGSTLAYFGLRTASRFFNGANENGQLMRSAITVAGIRGQSISSVRICHS